MKILILGGESYAKPWRATYPDCEIDLYDAAPLPVDVSQYDAIQFTGGTDVDPRLYGEHNTDSGAPDVARDALETYIFRLAQQWHIPCLGICRGSQFLRVMCAGKLVQHIEGHLGNHRAQFAHGGEFEVTSTHHQQAVVDSVYFFDFLTADNGTVVEGWMSRSYPKVYAVQYHPEFMDTTDEGFKFYQDVIRTALGGQTIKWEIKI